MGDSMTDVYKAYLLIDNATDSYAVLGLSQSDAPTASQVKSAYRSLALLLHPDKAPSNAFAGTHHRLFLKLQQAHEDLLKGNSGAPHVPVVSEHLTILEGPISLHQRNLDFKAQLRERRDAAVQQEHGAKAKKAVARAAWERKTKAASSKPDRAAEKLFAQQGGKITTKQARQAAHNLTQKQAEPRAPWQPKTSSNHATVKATRRTKADATKQYRISTHGNVEDEVHEAKNDPIYAPPRDLAYRRNKELLSGCPSNTSMAEQTHRNNTIVSKEVEVEKWIQSQHESRMAKAIAKMQRKGIFFPVDSIEHENLGSRIEQELREEAEWHFGVDPREFLGFH